ncbi:WD40 repeat-like protein [Auriculariales sp. MPI-PUGE-AT-0066]|nr:WD40 repeat-like protein [Auriculariales sp. MPI-PUGE-AT-0066]
MRKRKATEVVGHRRNAQSPTATTPEPTIDLLVSFWGQNLSGSVTVRRLSRLGHNLARKIKGAERVAEAYRRRLNSLRTLFLSIGMSSKKSSQRPPKSRPASTFNAPTADGVVTQSFVSQFSPKGTEFAIVSLALDKPHLRVFNVATSRMTNEQTLDGVSSVSCITWATLRVEDAADALPAKKRKKQAAGATSTLSASDEHVVALGLSNGGVSIYSPRHGRVLRTLQHATSSSPVVAVGAAAGTLWVSTTDGTLRRWDITSGDETGSWKRPSASTFLAPRPDHPNELLECSHDARLLSFDDEDEPEELAHLSGHASSIIDLAWIGNSRVATSAEGDRVVSVWDVASGAVLATLPLDSDALGVSSLDSTLVARSGTGRAFVAALPVTLSAKKPATLEIESTVSISLKGSGASNITGVFLRPEHRGRVCIARLSAGVRPIFESVQYLDEAGAYISDVKDSAVHDMQRYREGPSVAGGVAAADEPAVPEGHLDAAAAELSLGQRLGLSLKPQDEDEDDVMAELDKGHHIKAHKVPRASGSIARTLVQALHASDSQLLDTVIRYGSDTRVVQATVRRLPPTLAVPFLTACTERLGKRAQGAQIAGPQRGIVLINWIRAVLVVHGAHLLTMPDLVQRLAALHATLTTRSAMQDRLLALSGRLDLAMAQAALRTPAAPKPQSKKADPGKATTLYVEGQSDDDAMDEDDASVASGSDDEILDDLADSDAASEELVELGDDDDLASNSGEEDEDEDDDDEDDDDEDEGPGARRKSALVDDEAEEEEWDDEESSDEE